MKTKNLAGMVFGISLLISYNTYCQNNYDLSNTPKSKKMETTQKNKEVVKKLYKEVLNKRNLNQLHEIVSDDYTDANGDKGVEAFLKPIVILTNAFPDISWKVDKLICEGNEVVISWELQGTNKAPFQNFETINKTISNEGMAIYQLSDYKIIHAIIQTDRLGFLQQLEVLPANLKSLSNNRDRCFLIDEFYVPKNSIEEFVQRMNYNRNFIKTLPGFLKDDVYKQTSENGDLVIITVASWENIEYLNNAKNSVLSEYKRINFNPAEFYQRLNIKMERGIFNKAYFTE